MNPISTARKLGQCLWLDSLSRQMIQEGHLQQKIRQGVTGVTTNPAIFKAAMSQDKHYQEVAASLKLHGKECYEVLAVDDVQAACDLLHDVYLQGGAAGFVSIETDPCLADDYTKTIDEALRLWAMIDRPNAMIKIAATAAGIRVCETLIAQGIPVNMTLIFSIKTLAAIYDAYTAALQKRLANHQAISHLRLVTSVFLSRFDVLLDEILPENLRGQAAKMLAYQADEARKQWQAQAPWQTIARQGAHLPYLLWASTATKNPAYDDLLYVNDLVTEHSINTLPEKTLAAFLDHGKPRAINEHDYAWAAMHRQRLESAGIDMEKVAAALQSKGLALFREDYLTLMQSF